MSIDIAAIAVQHIEKMTAEGRLEQLIQKQIEATVDAAVKDAVATHSEFGSLLRKLLKSNVNDGIGKIGFPSYSDLVLKIIKGRLDAILEKETAAAFEENLAELLADYPKEITISDLAAKFAKYIREERAGSCHCGPVSNEFTFIVHQADAVDGYFSIYFDERAPRDIKTYGDKKYCCKYSLSCTKDGEVYSAKAGGEELKKLFLLGPCYEFSRFILHAYTSKLKVIRDTDTPDTHIPDYDEEED